ncbi:MAG: acetyltransferase [Candidatus Melainabacteria bacterium]|nr:acetyltransferase [Candidatus Melainabacteria bacterium]
MTQTLLVLGTRPFSQEIADVASEVPGYSIAGFVENLDKSRCKIQFEEGPIFWIDDIDNMVETHEAICGIGTTFRFKFTDQVAAKGMKFATVIHPTARVSSKSTMGQGSLVSVQSVIAAYTTLGEHVLINRGVIVGHHTSIGNFSSVMMGARVAGDTRIGQCTYIGLGAIVKNGVTIGDHCIVGAGAVVTKDLPDNVMAYGIPARIVKENIEGL